MVLGFDSDEKLTAQMIKDRKRRLAEAFHPDRPGGSTRQMQKVNQAAEVLIASLAGRP